MKIPEDNPTRGFWMTMLALLSIGGATVAALWLLSYFCLTQPSSPVNLSDWECGGWSPYLGVGILVAGVVSMSLAWKAINRRM